MKLKQILFLGCVIALFSCSKEDITEPFDPAKLISSVYSTKNCIIEFISKDSLIYRNTLFPESSFSYRAKYTLDENKLSFAGKDTVRIDYKDPILDRESFMLYYYCDSFEGYFENAQVLQADEIWYGYEGYGEGKYLTATSSVTMRKVIFNKYNN